MTAEPARIMPRALRYPPAPAHLGDESRRFWRQIVRTYALEVHHVALLERACEALDRLAEARRAIAADGITVAGRSGPRAHPAVAIERDSRLAFARLLRELGLDYSETPATARTAAASRARWR